MMIETYKEAYAVMRHYYAGLYLDIYVCRRRLDQQLYTMIRVRNKKTAMHILPFISAQKHNPKFSDLLDAFVFQGDLHVVFCYAEGIPLQKKLQQPCSLEERMEIGRKLLERLILLGQPYYFQCQCLQPENIIVEDTLDVKFQYTFFDIEHYHTYTRQQAAAHLYQAFAMLFASECKKGVSASMDAFFQNLEGENEWDYLTQYQIYCNACAEIKKIPKEDFKQDNFMEHVWNLAKSVRGLVRRTLLAVIFAGVFFYMVWSIFWSFWPRGYACHFPFIGTVEFDQYE